MFCSGFGFKGLGYFLYNGIVTFNCILLFMDIIETFMYVVIIILL